MTKLEPISAHALTIVTGGAAWQPRSPQPPSPWSQTPGDLWKRAPRLWDGAK